MMTRHICLVLIAALVLLGGCSDRGTGAPQASPAVTDAWLGRWTGPEGTFLLLAGGNGTYRVTIQNLDGPRVFAGVGTAGQIRFERDGVTELIHATDGAGTGMKWLADKTDCLTVRFGEGYCRD
jgi:hypothetical protein